MQVTRFSVTPVKGLGLHHPDEIVLGPRGVVENRRFFLVDFDGRLCAGVRHGPLVRIRAGYDPAAERLTLTFPDGHVVDGTIELGGPAVTNFYGRPVTSREVKGPWAEALSDYTGSPLRLQRADRPGDGLDVHVATLVSTASVEEVGRQARRDCLDARRFRMLIEIDGCEPHDEDGWDGRQARAGEAVLRIGGPVPRCAVTTQNPTTGVPDLETLRVLLDYRKDVPEPKPYLGVYAQIEQPGRVRVGDPVELL